MKLQSLNVAFQQVGLVLISVLLSACSSVHHFSFQPGSDESTIDERLLNVLSHEGFRARDKALPEETRAIGVTGYLGCEAAEDVRVLEKEWRSFGQYHWVWVHSFKCNGAPKFVVSSSPNADSEAKRTQRALKTEFRKEAGSGILQISDRARLPLE